MNKGMAVGFILNTAPTINEARFPIICIMRQLRYFDSAGLR
jgi:hypothetical protein